MSEPNAAIATALRVVLEENGYAVDVISDPEELRARDLSVYGALVVDVHRAPRTGLDEIEWLYRTRSDLRGRIVVITGDDVNAIQEALETAGVCNIVVKPVSVTEIVRAVQECVERNPELAVH